MTDMGLLPGGGQDMLAGPGEQTQVDLLTRADLCLIFCPVSYRSQM